MQRFPPTHACEHTFCSMIVCVLLPRFELAVAAGGREALAAGPLALAPEVGREPLIGETSAAAEAHGVRAGLRLGEALARCPTLRLVTPDPGRRRGRLGSASSAPSKASAPPWRPTGQAWPGSTSAASVASTAERLRAVIAATRRALGRGGTEAPAPPPGRVGAVTRARDA